MNRRVRRSACGTLVGLLMVAGGCLRGPTLLPPADRKPIDRAVIETPSNTEIRPYIRGLTAPVAICFVREEGAYDGALLIAESGRGGYRPRIYGYKADGTYFDIFPTRIPVPFGILKSDRDIYGPIGGMVCDSGRIYVTHRDAQGMGTVSAFDFTGNRTTIAGGLPAHGDYSLTDIAVHPTTGRLYFGLGSATNSGVVGLDNWAIGWVKKHPKFCDVPFVPLKLLGFRFDTPNPAAGIFGGADLAVTAPFSPFGVSNQTRIPKAPDGKPTAAIYSVSPRGGDLRVEAHGIRLPRGLAFNEFSSLFMTNNGMDLRGTRPVKDDPDVLLKLSPGQWYGWPDFSADLNSVAESRYQPPQEMIQARGYPENSSLIDHAGSGLSIPTPFKDQLLFGVLPALSGAARLVFVPSAGPFKEYRGSAIIALSGDRSPFATANRKLKAPVGFKVIRVDPDNKQAREFIRNTDGIPASMIKPRVEALERPIDVKFGPDGKLYILDFGRMEVRDGKEHISAGTGKIFVLEPVVDVPAATIPTAQR